MPSHRKRIGFLPSQEVHDIIEEICLRNKYSQSKVTGLLVEEALRSRGILREKLSERSKIKEIFNDIKEINNPHINLEFKNNSGISTFDKHNLKEDIKMINEFIEYKLFKKIINEKRDLFE